MSLEIKRCIGSWEISGPSRRDALLMLALAFDLLGEALPLAVNNIGSLPPHEQLKFWWAFVDFERATDLDGNGGDSEFDWKTIAEKLSDWREICHLRATGSNGDLRDAPEDAS